MTSIVGLQGLLHGNPHSMAENVKFNILSEVTHDELYMEFCRTSRDTVS